MPSDDRSASGNQPVPASGSGQLVPPSFALVRSSAAHSVSALYYNIAGLRTRNDPVALQFVASQPHEGTSLIARQFATFAAEADAGSALLVNCTIGQDAPKRLQGKGTLPTLMDAYLANGDIATAIAQDNVTPGLHTAVLCDPGGAALHRNPESLPAVLSQLRKRYHFVILDTPPLEQPVSLLFPRNCDGVVLVLEAERTSAAASETTIEAIERAGGKILGFVFNKRRLYMPRWLYRRF